MKRSAKDLVVGDTFKTFGGNAVVIGCIPINGNLHFTIIQFIKDEWKTSNRIMGLNDSIILANPA